MTPVERRVGADRDEDGDAMSSEGRSVLVTGAGRGIGRVIATTLAAGGWTVVLAGRNRAGLEETAELVSAAGGTGHVRQVDVSEAESVAELAAALAADGLTPHAVVNNSGVAGPSKPLWEVEPDEWESTFAVNVRGVYLVCRAFLPSMVERGGGAVVTVGSITGKNPLVHRTPYAASKAALVGLTRTLAVDAGRYGVRVNLVSPGPVTGERLDWVVEARSEATGRSEAEVRADLTAHAALGRFVGPGEVADAVAFLLSDASAGITGVDLTVAAGAVMI
jgi:NAD(P)-dependent dehydrogenase (short-subunit alcohol dehydrogenase family)